mgnify:CR=1 FL=1
MPGRAGEREEEEERGKQLARKVSEEGGEGEGGKMETLKHLEKLGKGLWGLVGIARAEAGGGSSRGWGGKGVGSRRSEPEAAPA